MIDILRNPRFITANTLAALTLAATAGCSTELSPEEKINASYDRSFIDKPDTACYSADLDHDSVKADLTDEINQRPWLDIDSIDDTAMEKAAKDITTILTTIPELGDVSTSSHVVEAGSTYEFCVNDSDIQAGDPLNFTTALEYTPSSK